MVNERTKTAESIDTVHIHTHTPCSYKQNKSEVWRESYNLKSEKGSITIFVLTTMLVVLGVIFINFFTLMNKNNAQLAEIEKIQEEYNKTADMGTMEELYNSLITGLSTGEGVIEVLEGEKVQLPEPEITGEVGEITYSTTSSAITVDSKTGEVTGVDGGAEKEEATVVAKESNGEASCEYKIEVKVWYGEGTEESPYQISNKRDLEKLDEKVEKVASKGEEYRYTGKKFQQTTNIDLENGSIMIGQEGSEEETIAFNGEYDGNNKEINNLKIENNEIVIGFFTTVGEEGNIKNLTIGSGNINITNSTELKSGGHGSLIGINYGSVENCTNKIETKFGANHDHCGGLIGINKVNALIKKCYNYGKVTKSETNGKKEYNNNIGGIVGSNVGLVDNCQNYGEIISDSLYATGGIAGWNKGGTVQNSINNGNIQFSGESLFGGIIGTNENGAIVRKCTNYGNLKSDTALLVGGIVGINRYTNSIITECKNYGSVFAENKWEIGGIVGQVYQNASVEKSANYGFIKADYTTGGIAGTLRENSKINLCVNYGNVLGVGTQDDDFDIGGICGYVEKNTTIEDCYNKDAVIRGNDSIGGIAGANNGTINRCYNTGNSTSTRTTIGVGGIVGINQATGVVNNSYTQTGKDAKIIGNDVGSRNNVSFKEYSEMISDSFVNTLGTANWKKGGTTPILTWQEDEEYTGEIEEGVYMLYTALSPTNKVMDIANGETANGTNVQLYDMNYSQAQKFRISKTGKAGTYSIINVNSGKSLDVQNGSTANAANLQIYEPNGTTSQIWKIIDCKNGYYAIQSLLGSYIHVDSGQTANGTNIHMWNSADTTNKNCQWMLKKAIE